MLDTINIHHVTVGEPRLGKTDLPELTQLGGSRTDTSLGLSDAQVYAPLHCVRPSSECMGW